MSVKWNSAPIIAAVRRGASIGLIRGIGIVEQRAVSLLLNPPKSGRIYRRRGVEHQASAPGEAPASDSGRLVASRLARLIDGLRARLSFGTKYAMPLEVGTPKMEARPYARRALIETRNEVGAAIGAEIRTELAKVR